jgi:serine/threonine protein kinase
MAKTVTAWGCEPAPDPLGLDLLSKLLVYEPSSRLSAQQSLLHPYFDDLDKSAFR